MAERCRSRRWLLVGLICALPVAVAAGGRDEDRRREREARREEQREQRREQREQRARSEEFSGVAQERDSPEAVEPGEDHQQPHYERAPPDQEPLRDYGQAEREQPRWGEPDQLRRQQYQQQFQSLPPEKQERVRQAARRYRSMSPDERTELRRRWEGMSEEEREHYRQRASERQ